MSTKKHLLYALDAMTIRLFLLQLVFFILVMLFVVGCYSFSLVTVGAVGYLLGILGCTVTKYRIKKINAVERLNIYNTCVNSRKLQLAINER